MRLGLRPIRPLEFKAMGILELLPKTVSGNQFVVIITDIHSILKKEILSAKTTAAQVVTSLLCPWNMPYEIQSYLLTLNGVPVVGKFYSTIMLFPHNKEAYNNSPSPLDE